LWELKVEIHRARTYNAPPTGTTREWASLILVLCERASAEVTLGDQKSADSIFNTHGDSTLLAMVVNNYYMIDPQKILYEPQQYVQTIINVYFSSFHPQVQGTLYTAAMDDDVIQVVI